MTSRHFLMLLLLTLIVAGTNCKAEEGDSVRRKNQEPAKAAAHSASQPISAKAALATLREGNKRFVAGRSIHPHAAVDYRASLAKAQHPIATVITCSDSRVMPVLIFDQGVGDLFEIRVAGNVVDDVVAGSIEYAVDHLDTKLLVVMGHESCGAITAGYHAFVARDLESREPHEIETLLSLLEPALRNIDTTKTAREQIADAIEENVRQATRKLLRISDLHRAQEEGRLKVVGAVYSLRTGVVRLLDEETSK